MAPDPRELLCTLVSEVSLLSPPSRGGKMIDPDPSNNHARDVHTVIAGEVLPLAPPVSISAGGDPALVFESSEEGSLVFEEGTGAQTRVMGVRIDGMGVALEEALEISEGPGADAAVAFDPGVEPSSASWADLPPKAAGATLTVSVDTEEAPKRIVGRRLARLPRGSRFGTVDSRRPRRSMSAHGGWQVEARSTAMAEPASGHEDEVPGWHRSKS